MAYYAQIDKNNTVLNVITVDDNILLMNQNKEESGVEYCRSLVGEDTNWVLCYMNGIRYNFPSKGYRYSPNFGSHGAFLAPQPYPSWKLNSVAKWVPPEEKPVDGKEYFWDEEQKKWMLKVYVGSNGKNYIKSEQTKEGYTLTAIDISKYIDRISNKTLQHIMEVADNPENDSGCCPKMFKEP